MIVLVVVVSVAVIFPLAKVAVAELWVVPSVKLGVA